MKSRWPLTTFYDPWPINSLGPLWHHTIIEIFRPFVRSTSPPAFTDRSRPNLMMAGNAMFVSVWVGESGGNPIGSALVLNNTDYNTMSLLLYGGKVKLILADLHGPADILPCKAFPNQWSLIMLMSNNGNIQRAAYKCVKHFKQISFNSKRAAHCFLCR